MVCHAITRASQIYTEVVGTHSSQSISKFSQSLVTHVMLGKV